MRMFLLCVGLSLAVAKIVSSLLGRITENCICPIDCLHMVFGTRTCVYIGMEFSCETTVGSTDLRRASKGRYLESVIRIAVH